MAINRSGFIARLFARLARPAAPGPGSAGNAAPPPAANPVPRETAEEPVPAPAGESAPAGEQPEHDAPTAETPAGEAAGLPGREADAAADAAAGHPDADALPDADETAGTTPEDGTPEESAPASTDPGSPSAAPAPVARDHKVITLLSLVEHAGAKTLGAALERRTEGKGWKIRTAGPGLARAAFSGMLGDTDALVLVCPAEPAITAALGEKLRWLAANNRQGMQARTLIVVNLGTADGGELQLPADLDRPVTLLPFDAALSIPATGARAPRRAARAAIDQLVDELSTILQES